LVLLQENILYQLVYTYEIPVTTHTLTSHSEVRNMDTYKTSSAIHFTATNHLVIRIWLHHNWQTCNLRSWIFYS